MYAHCPREELNAMKRLKLLCLICAFVLILASGPAFAKDYTQTAFRLDLNNAYNEDIYVVVFYYNSVAADWVGFGWSQIAPGQTYEAYLRGAVPSSIKVYAKTYSGNKRWGGTSENDRIAVCFESGFWYKYNDKSTWQPTPDGHVIMRPLDLQNELSSYKYSFWN